MSLWLSDAAANNTTDGANVDDEWYIWITFKLEDGATEVITWSGWDPNGGPVADIMVMVHGLVP